MKLRLRTASAVVLIATAMACFAFAAMMWRYLGAYGTAGIVAIPWIALIAGLCCLAALKLSDDTRAAVAITLVSAVIAPLIAETLLSRSLREGFVGDVARGAGIQHDRRSRAEVVRELRAEGLNAWPALHGWVLRDGGAGGLRLEIPGPNGPLVPLTTGLAGATIVFCNESGRYQTYRADERGFNNPAGIWSRSPVDVLAIGDSYAQGFCVPEDSAIVPRLRIAWPRTLNLAISGTGPLIQLAVLREYLPITRPREVLWFYYEGNDLADLAAELRQPLLAHYLSDSAYRQDLPSLQGPVERALALFLDTLMVVALAQRDTAPASRMSGPGARSILKLTQLRALAGIGIALPPPPEHVETFRSIMAAAQREITGAGGRLHFVYLPAYERYTHRLLQTDAARERILGIVGELGIPVIDIHRAFQATGDPQSLWVHPQGHYNGNGYGVVATAVQDALSRATVEAR